MMLGRRVTLAEAREAVNFPLLVPERQGFAEPPEIYLTGEGDPMVSFVYPAGPGLPPATGDIGALLTQFPGRVDRGMIEKGLYATGDADASALESVSVGGERGFWLSGAPHTFFIVCDDGNECREERYRLAGNVLLWERNALTLRFESALSQDEALAIATSLRPVE